MNISKGLGILSIFPTNASPNGVAPVRASAFSAIQTLSPDISDGYAKNRKALAVSAGLRIFIPVPPNTSLPIITAKAVATATIQSGISGGRMSGIIIPVTKKPSFTSCPRTWAKANSMPKPTT